MTSLPTGYGNSLCYAAALDNYCWQESIFSEATHCLHNRCNDLHRYSSSEVWHAETEEHANACMEGAARGHVGAA